MSLIKIITNPGGALFSQTLEEFLQSLAGPTWLTFEGKDTSRTRVITTLLHGNEPSGVRAIHQWLRTFEKPATNIVFFIGSVAAAMTSPRFSYRYLPEAEDLNRCFKPPFDTPTRHVAKELMDLIDSVHPEVLIDMHNTSGSSIGFAITIDDSEQCEALATLFTDRLIMTELQLGSLMEFGSTMCPCITVECGGIEDAASDIVALEGIKRVWQIEDILSRRHAQDLNKIYHPHRLELKHDSVIGYSSSKVPEWDLTLPLDVEQYNYKTLQPDTAIGWLGAKGLDVLQIIDNNEKNIVSKYFYTQDNQLKAKMALKLFMVTTNPRIALADCLFYLVAPQEQG